MALANYWLWGIPNVDIVVQVVPVCLNSNPIHTWFTLLLQRFRRYY